jgi:excisionase family DNA binding protein
MINTAEPSILVSQTEVARLLGGIDRSTLWRMVGRGDLDQVKVGSRAMITRASLDRFVADNTKAA